MKFEIKMKSTRRGRDEGGESRVQEYLAGETYSVGQSLRDSFVKHLKVAVDVLEAPAPPPPALKKAAGPEENKGAKAAKVAESK